MTIFLPPASARFQAFPFSFLPVTSGALSPTFGRGGAVWAEAAVAVNSRPATMDSAVSAWAFMEGVLNAGLGLSNVRNNRTIDGRMIPRKAPASFCHQLFFKTFRRFSFLDVPFAHQLEHKIGILAASLRRQI